MDYDYGDMARRWESSGKALKAHGRVSWWTVLRSGFETWATWPGTGKSSGKALKRPTEGFRVVVDRASPRF